MKPRRETMPPVNESTDRITFSEGLSFMDISLYREPCAIVIAAPPWISRSRIIAEEHSGRIDRLGVFSVHTDGEHSRKRHPHILAGHTHRIKPVHEPFVVDSAAERLIRSPSAKRLSLASRIGPRVNATCWSTVCETTGISNSISITSP